MSLALEQPLRSHLCKSGVPKGPSRTKNSTESKFATARKNATAIAERYGE